MDLPDGETRVERGRVGRALMSFGILGMCVLGSGCVERRMTIRTTPPNALVIVDGQEVGHTPVSMPFTYYGEREFKLIKDGYETKVVYQRISTPWYQYPPLDFASEALWPVRIRDKRNYLYTMEPKTTVSTEGLLQRAAIVREDGKNPPAEALRKANVLDEDAPTVQQPIP